MKVVVLTTSYPRGERDVAGLFVRDAVEAVRAQGVEVEVVSPASFRHYGIAYGHGIAGNLRRRPWLALLLPAFLFNYAWAARRAAQDADLVHAHWLPSALAALKTGKPYVVQLWGTDVELARQAPWLFRPLLRRARLAIVASEYLADAARELGAREVRVVPSGVEIPEAVGEPDEPPHVLFVGRLSPEKGIHEFLAATEGMPRVIVGAGPVEVPEAVGFVPRSRARPVLRARRGRVRPVAPGGLRHRGAGGDGLRPAGGGDGGRRPRRRHRRPRPAGRRRAAARGARAAARGRRLARAPRRAGARAGRERAFAGTAQALPSAPPTTPRSAAEERPQGLGRARAGVAVPAGDHVAGLRPLEQLRDLGDPLRLRAENGVRAELLRHAPLGRVAEREAADAERRRLLLDRRPSR